MEDLISNQWVITETLEVVLSLRLTPMNQTLNLEDTESLVSNPMEAQLDGELPTLTLTLEITIPIGFKQTRNHLTIKYQLMVAEALTISTMNAETQTSMLMATYSQIHMVILAAFMSATKVGAVATRLMSSTPCRCAALAVAEKIPPATVVTVTEMATEMEMEMVTEMAMVMVTGETYQVWMIYSWLLNKLQPMQSPS